MKKSTRQPKATARRASRTQIAIALSALLALSACASAPQPPTRELQAAEQAIRTAEQAQAGNHAALEMREARDKLAAARAAVQKEEMVQGQWLADESRVAAELASARTAAVTARTVNDEMQQSTDTLEQEMDRNTEIRQ